MHETPQEVAHLQRLLDESYAHAGPHLRGIIDPQRRVDAEALCSRLQGMRLLALASSTADGRPLVGPVDGYFLHGAFYFSLGSSSVRIRHLRQRPACSALHLPGEEFAVSVHGRAVLFDVNDPAEPLREAMLAHYVPLQGPSFQEWLDNVDATGGRIEADKLFTFTMHPVG